MKTSQTGRRLKRGFTLLEILVVLTLVGLLTGLAVPLYERMAARLEVTRATQELVTVLRIARSEALATKQTVPVVFYPATQQIAAPGRLLRLPVTFQIEDSTGLARDEDKVTLHFYPDGSATPLVFRLSVAKRSALIRIDWLTGRAVINEG